MLGKINDLNQERKWENKLSFKAKYLSKDIVSVTQIIVLNPVKLNLIEYFVKIEYFMLQKCAFKPSKQHSCGGTIMI